MTTRHSTIFFYTPLIAFLCLLFSANSVFAVTVSPPSGTSLSAGVPVGAIDQNVQGSRIYLLKTIEAGTGANDWPPEEDVCGYAGSDGGGDISNLGTIYGNNIDTSGCPGPTDSYTWYVRNLEPSQSGWATEYGTFTVSPAAPPGPDASSSPLGSATAGASAAVGVSVGAGLIIAGFRRFII